MDFDDINMLSFEKGERIIDMRIYHNKNKNNENDIEKIIIACTKNMIFKFIGKEKTFGELFKKYSNGSEIYQNHLEFSLINLVRMFVVQHVYKYYHIILIQKMKK